MSTPVAPPSTESRLHTWLLLLGLLVLIPSLLWHAFLVFVALGGISLQLPPGWPILLVGALPSTGTAVLLLLIGSAAAHTRPGSSAVFFAFVSLVALGLVLYLAAYALLSGQAGSTTLTVIMLYQAFVGAGAMANLGGLFALLLMVLPGTPPTRGAPPPPP